MIGRVYRSLGQNEKAMDLLKRAVEIRRGASGPPDEVLASTLRDLSEVYAGLLRKDEAVQTAEEALVIGRRISKPPSDDIARGLNSLGVALRAAGRYDEADSVLQMSYSQMRALRREDDE